MNILSRVVVCMASVCGLCVSSQAQTDIFSYIISESGKTLRHPSPAAGNGLEH